MKIAVVSAHRGDAALSLGLAIEAWLAKGHAVEVVSCFTRSEFAPYSDAGSLHANDRVSFVTAVRKREDEAWRKQVGSAKLTLTDLNLKDAPIRLHLHRDKVFDRPVDVSEKVVSKIRRAMEMSKAGAVVLPLGLGGHVDSASARDAAMPVDASLPVAFYEEIPYAMKGVDEGALDAAIGQLPVAMRAELQSTLVGGVGEVNDAVARMRRVAWCYDSQMDEAMTSDVAEFCRRYAGRERVWANAAWRDSDLNL